VKKKKVFKTFFGALSKIAEKAKLFEKKFQG